MKNQISDYQSTGTENLIQPSPLRKNLSKLQIIVLRKFSPGFRKMEKRYELLENNPEFFFNDGEAVFTKKEKYFINLLSGQ
ncbi:hypothetical protein HME9304_01836 [Flagellimonas maritima]|uniref:Uncharacterized protein n=2 Tax=Flagellimonas maritima TaxID=1383885 RepID=A0A2Z4LSE5_9FLAO|nr:hypothetical protein HME9304_01836 [Allomuricauda aurantiaca]